VQYQQHAQGECRQASNATISIPVEHYFSRCGEGVTVDCTFPIYHQTNWGENIFVVGNITELGNWDPYKGVALNAIQYTGANPLWDGGNANIAAGASFEYKFIQWGINGTLTWECGPNRVYTIPSDQCVSDIVVSGPQNWRDGQTQSCDLDS